MTENSNLQQQLTAFSDAMEAQVQACATASDKAAAILAITKAARELKARIVDPHLHELVPEVLQRNLPDSFEEKKLWATLLNDSCNRTGQAITTRNEVLCSAKAKDNATTPKGYFILQQKHGNSSNKQRTGATNRIEQPLTVVHDPLAKSVAREEREGGRGRG